MISFNLKVSPYWLDIFGKTIWLMDLNQQRVYSLHPNTDKGVITAKSDNSKIWVLPYDSSNSLDFLSDACDCSVDFLSFDSSYYKIVCARENTAHTNEHSLKDHRTTRSLLPPKEFAPMNTTNWNRRIGRTAESANNCKSILTWNRRIGERFQKRPKV